jgi:hypothetical protein
MLRPARTRLGIHQAPQYKIGNARMLPTEAATIQMRRSVFIGAKNMPLIFLGNFVVIVGLNR